MNCVSLLVLVCWCKLLTLRVVLHFLWRVILLIVLLILRFSVSSTEKLLSTSSWLGSPCQIFWICTSASCTLVNLMSLTISLKLHLLIVHLIVEVILRICIKWRIRLIVKSRLMIARHVLMHETHRWVVVLRVERLLHSWFSHHLPPGLDCRVFLVHLLLGLAVILQVLIAAELPSASSHLLMCGWLTSELWLLPIVWGIVSLVIIMLHLLLWLASDDIALRMAMSLILGVVALWLVSFAASLESLEV